MSTPAPILNPADVIGRRWVVDVRDPKPNKRYLHVIGGPFQFLGGWCYWLAGSCDGAGPLVSESVLQHAMAEGVEVPLGTDPLDYTCRECGCVWNPSHYSNDQIGMAHRARGLCSNDAYWDEAHQDYVAGKRLVVACQSYTIGPEQTSGPRGHGGERFRIQYPDGRVVESTNLWSQGPIPERWRGRMPDTAVFIKDEPAEGHVFQSTGFLRREVKR